MSSPEVARARDYYDRFSAVYESRRDGRSRYHDLLDDLEFELAAPYLRGREVLEVGCGTGLLLRRFGEVARRAKGVDLSPGMLSIARQRGLDVVEGNATALPFESASFDVALSFKTLAHVPDLGAALREMTRVVRPGGVVIAEVYNPTSLRGLTKWLLPPGRVADGTERDVFCRYDDRPALDRALPPGTIVERIRGIRLLLPAAFLLELPGLGRALVSAERALTDTKLAAHAAGFVCYVLRRS